MAKSRSLGAAVLELRTDDKPFDAGLKGARRSAEKATKELRGTANRTQGSWDSAFAKMAASVLTVSTAIKLLNGAIENAKLASKFDQMAGAFQNAASRMGRDAGSILASIDEAAAGTISRMEALTAASRAQLLQVPIDQLGRFTEIARAASIQTGESVQFMLDSLVTGIGRASPLILDNVIGTVKMAEVTEAYADSLGVAVDGLTEAQRKLALVNAVLLRGDEIIADVGAAMDELTDTQKWEQLRVAIANAKLELGKGLAPVLADVAFRAAQMVTELVDALSLRNVKRDIIAAVEEGVFAGRLFELNLADTLLWQKAILSLRNTMATAGGDVTTLDGSLQLVQGRLNQLRGAMDVTVPLVETLEAGMGGVASATDGAARAMARFGASMHGTVEDLERLAEIGFVDAFRMSGPQNQQPTGTPRAPAGPGGDSGMRGLDAILAERGGPGPQSGTNALMGAFAGLVDIANTLGGMFMDTVGTLGSVMAVLNPLQTIFQGMMSVLQPLIDSALKPLVGILRIIGQTLGKVLAPVFKVLGDVIGAVAQGFVWFFNKIIRPIGNLLIGIFSLVGAVIAHFVNALLALIQIVTLGIVRIPRVPVPRVGGGQIGEISFEDATAAGASDDTAAGAGAAGATFQQQRPISVRIDVHDNEVFGGSLQDFAILLRTTFQQLDVLGI